MDKPTTENSRDASPSRSPSRADSATSDQVSNTPSAHSRGILIASWAFVALMLGVIFFMSAQTGEKLDNDTGIITIVRNALITLTTSIFGHEVDVSPIGHFTEFFLLGLGLVNALRLSLSLRVSSVAAVMIASLYGITDELHQLFVPMRSCDPMDWLVDTVAALLAVVIFAVIYRLRSRSEKDSL